MYGVDKFGGVEEKQREASATPATVELYMYTMTEQMLTQRCVGNHLTYSSSAECFRYGGEPFPGYPHVGEVRGAFPSP